MGISRCCSYFDVLRFSTEHYCFVIRWLNKKPNLITKYWLQILVEFINSCLSIVISTVTTHSLNSLFLKLFVVDLFIWSSIHLFTDFFISLFLYFFISFMSSDCRVRADQTWGSSRMVSCKLTSKLSNASKTIDMGCRAELCWATN